MNVHEYFSLCANKPLENMFAFIPMSGRFQNIKDCVSFGIHMKVDGDKEIWYLYHGCGYTLCRVNEIDDQELFSRLDEIAAKMNNDLHIYKLLLL